MTEPRIEDATDEDLYLAIDAIGSKAQWGGLLSCTLAGIYAERKRTEKEVAKLRAKLTQVAMLSWNEGLDIICPQLKEIVRID